MKHYNILSLNEPIQRNMSTSLCQASTLDAKQHTSWY